MNYENTELEADIPKKRMLSKTRCKDIDWYNLKEITAYEIAYCIYTHNLSIDDVPEKRRRSVQEEIDKVVKKKVVKKKAVKKKEPNPDKESIESILSIYESQVMISELLGSDTKIDNLPPDSPDTFIEYIFNPKLFANVESARLAVQLIDDVSADIINSIMRDGVVYKDSKYSKKFKNALEAKKRLVNAYEKIGIPQSVTYKALDSISYEKNTTIKQELSSQRKEIADKFTALGNSQTNADKIAKEITIHCEKLIFTTSKF